MWFGATEGKAGLWCLQRGIGKELIIISSTGKTDEGKNMKILCANLQSIKSKLSELGVILIQNEVDVACLQELRTTE